MTAKPTVVVVGGSIAGLQTAQTLRQLGFDGSVTLLAEEKHAPYQRPPLSKSVLAGTRAAESTTIATSDPGVELVLGTRAVALDRRGRAVVTSDDRRWSYDHLVVATGARARTLTDEPDEFVLRTIDDCLRLRDAVQGSNSLLVIGGGFLGMEVASTCASLGLDVTVVDREPPLRRLLGVELAEWVCARARAQGVRILQVDPTGARLQRADRGWVYRSGDVVLHADVAVTAVGDIPNTEWLRGAGLALDVGLCVDVEGRADEGIYGVGDVSARQGATGAWGRTPFWSAALEQAHQVAHCIVGLPPSTPVGAGYYWSEQFGVDLRLCGEFPPAGSPLELDGSLASGSAVLGWSPTGRGTQTVAAVNHRTPIGRLTRWLAADPEPSPSAHPWAPPLQKAGHASCPLS